MQSNKTFVKNIFPYWRDNDHCGLVGAAIKCQSASSFGKKKKTTKIELEVNKRRHVQAVRCSKC